MPGAAGALLQSGCPAADHSRWQRAEGSQRAFAGADSAGDTGADGGGAETHRADLAAGYAGTFLPGQLEKKYKNAAREFRWQWFFPATTLTKVADSTEKRRYHLHDSHVQAAVKRATEAAGVAKRVSPHTFRHTFASHLLLAGYDLPTIQRLVGHGDVKTTMIYVQTVPTIRLKEVKPAGSRGWG